MTDTLSLASQFINSTSGHIFLTGKAGTGKTTFLRNLSQSTHKQFLVVAPTGIAALNAKGVTIHSQFALPFGSFLPIKEAKGSKDAHPGFFTGYVLGRYHPLNNKRKQVLRNIDLLVIDEVSMLRADILDAIDYRLKSAKGNYQQPFGGVQLLLIGDLYQLPPIVRDKEWEHLREHYASMHFFESVALKQAGYTYIELDKIFRQQDEVFISLLNNLRNNCCTAADIERLNSHFRPEVAADNSIITLCTHNHQADRINQQSLEELKGKVFSYKAEVEGDFPENMYPINLNLELKVGARVMFVKNDTLENRFVNGKLAEVTKLTKDAITVVLDGEKSDFEVVPMEWKNIRYVINETTKELEEETAGVFSHFPIKLAWAITVHKSQGLTFDKAMVDVGQAFAPGQVYVALSRLRSLEGLVLRTRINTNAISSDGVVVRYSQTKLNQEDLPDKLRAEQVIYLRETLRKTFDFEAIINQIDEAERENSGTMTFEDPEMQVALTALGAKFQGEKENGQKFQGQIAWLLHEQNHELLRERIEKGSNYYLNFLNDCQYDLLLHMEEVKLFSKTKTYVSALEDIDQTLTHKISDLLKAGLLTQSILTGVEVPPFKEIEARRKTTRLAQYEKIKAWMEENPRKASTKTGKVKQEKKTPTKGDTYRITFDLLNKGMSLEAVATERKMALSTIETHASKGIAAGELDIFTFMNKEELEEISAAFLALKAPVSGLSEVFTTFGGKYNYGRLRMVQSHLKREEKADQDE